jgi:hypothetical protein
MKHRFTIAAMVLALGSATASTAAVSTDSLVAGLLAEGYAVAEVTTRIGQIVIEARRGTRRFELTFDAETGALLGQETREDSALTGLDDRRPAPNPRQNRDRDDTRDDDGLADDDTRDDDGLADDDDGHDDDGRGAGRDDDSLDDGLDDDDGRDAGENDDSGDDESDNSDDHDSVDH